ncbi:MAG TPA: DNA repair protein RecN [Firmicutes bacterium]|nr:DNA repair protein RecN [Bacillota bacterium]
MLQDLHVSNFGLIEDLTIMFDRGLNVLTGETGAGKTMIVDAISLLLGGRGSSEMIRQGSDSAFIECSFYVPPGSQTAKQLTDAGFPPDSDGLLVFSREITSSGRSRCKVNGNLTTAGVMSQIGSYLVDIHGQHEHQSLLRPDKQLELLDAFAGPEILLLRGRVEDLVKKLRDLTKELETVTADGKQLASKVELLRFELDEIRSARLAADEEEKLSSERTILANSEKLYSHATKAYSLLYSGDGEHMAAQDLLALSLSELQAALALDPSLQPLCEALEGALTQITEVSRDVRGYADRIEFRPDRLAEVESRLALIQRLRRKYGKTVAELMEYAEKIESELSRISNSSERASLLKKEIDKIKGELGELCGSLSRMRKEVAKELSNRISRELNDLAMQDAVFEINFTSRESPDGIPVNGKLLDLGPKGVDQVEFLISANPGEEPKPLSRVASGGELSRIMLAIRTVLAEADEILTLIFDEIDAGIGGRAAAKVAQKLASIGKVRQVLCVTHLAQIAGAGDSHFYISKEVIGGRTRSNVAKLEDQERVVELARMLSGNETSEITLRHAREILENARMARDGERVKRAN